MSPARTEQTATSNANDHRVTVERSQTPPLQPLSLTDVTLPPPPPPPLLARRLATSIPDMSSQPLNPSSLPTMPTSPRPTFKSFSSTCLHSPTTELRTYCDASPTDMAATPTWRDANRPSRFVFSISPPRGSSCLGDQSPQEYRPLCGPRVRGQGGHGGPKEDEDEDVSRRARWIIITTAVSLFVMSVLLVGIMLRLAPVIDDLVRKENENLFRLPASTTLLTTAAPSTAVPDNVTSLTSAG